MFSEDTTHYFRYGTTKEEIAATGTPMTFSQLIDDYLRISADGFSYLQSLKDEDFEKVIFPDDFDEVCRRSVGQRGLDTQFFVVVQELSEVIDLVTRLGRVGRGGRDSEEEILERMPSEIADSLVGIRWLMKRYEISSEVISELIERKVQVMRESLRIEEERPIRREFVRSC